MEVGAVKQAFNNEVIQLKKNLNQAKIQVIHKLTRKAKTLVEKKTAEHLKEKNKRKAESAVKEVLIMKKLKPRDIARFIITYKGELISHLNKPEVDSDKACARLLLNKSLQQKYKVIKDKFGDIPIKDLLMSRQERRKLKKEAKDAQKNKKKSKVVNAEGDWNVEDVDEEVKGDEVKDDNDGESDDGSNDDVSDGNQNEEAETHENQSEVTDIGDVSDDDTPITREVVNGSDESSGEQSVDDDQESAGDSNDEDMELREGRSEDSQSDNDEELNTGNLVKLKPIEQKKPLKPFNLKLKSAQSDTLNIDDVLSKLKQKKKPDKKVKENKNKNLNDKMINRKFKKDTDDSLNTVKVVDPFFKTVTGGNYMSVAEPREPDEVKDVHRQGNRQERRAAMFGRAPIRPRRDDRNGPNRFNDGIDRKTKFNDRNNFNDRNSNLNDNSKFNGNNTKFNDRNSKFNDGNSKYNNSKFSDRKFNNVTEPKEEKLHPSWEAKKKQSGILPFQGKKIVFDES